MKKIDIKDLSSNIIIGLLKKYEELKGFKNLPFEENIYVFNTELKRRDRIKKIQKIKSNI